MTPEQQIQFDRIEKERRERERDLLLALLLVSDETATHARFAVRLGHDPIDATNSVIAGNEGIDQPGLTGALAQAMAEADIAGFKRVYRMAGVEPPEIDPEHPGELAEYYTPYAQAATDALNQHIAARIRKAMDAGETIAEVSRAISAELKQGGYSRSNPSALERIATEAILQAYNGGMWDGYQMPDVSDRLLGFVHCSVVDEVTTEICRQRAGLTLKKDNPYWTTNWPKLHFGCRSVPLPIFKGMPFVESDFLPTIPPMLGFGRAPLTVHGYAFA